MKVQSDGVGGTHRDALITKRLQFKIHLLKTDLVYRIYFDIWNQR